MKFQQNVKTKQIELHFTFKERISILFKGYKSLSLIGSKEFINQMAYILFRWTENLPKKYQNKMSDSVDTEME